MKKMMKKDKKMHHKEMKEENLIGKLRFLTKKKKK